MPLDLEDLKFRRKVLRIKDTFYVSVPYLFAEAIQLRGGQYVDIKIQPDGSIKIIKEVVEE